MTLHEVVPPFAALDLYADQVCTGYRAVRQPGDVARDRFETAAAWERHAITAPREQKAALARIGRAFLTGESPRTRAGRWRRDLRYLEDVAAEAAATLSGLRAEKYAQMVAEWRKREPLGIIGRYKALRNRLKQEQERGKAPTP